MRAHRTLPTLLLCAATALLNACAFAPPIKGPPAENLHLAEAIDAIQAAVEPVWDGGISGVKLDSVKVSLQTVHDNKVNGEVDYLLLAVKGYYDHADTQQIDITFSTRPPAPSRSVGPSSTQKITDDLRALIENAQKQIKSSYGEGHHKLYTNEIDLQIQFLVTYDASAGVQKWALLPTSVSGAYEFSAKTANTIVLQFKVPQKAGL